VSETRPAESSFSFPIIRLFTMRQRKTVAPGSICSGLRLHGIEETANAARGALISAASSRGGPRHSYG